MNATPQLDPILRNAEVLHVTGLSKTQLYRLIRAKKFPGAVKLSERASGWRSSEVASWLESLPRSTSEGSAM